ncbi:hypothetical protein BGZ58_008200 [Dissophora ornata]|nr:hypothetical protein BGZ58_008200 [Dissophora ornata]
MSSAYGSIARPTSDQSLATILPRHAVLRSNANAEATTVDSTPNATLLRIASNETFDNSTQTYTLNAGKHQALVEAMHQVFNREIERGDTYPQEFTLDTTQFNNYFFSADTFVLLKGHHKQATDLETRKEAKDWEQDLLGYFYIKPNYPICNGGFIVNPIHRGLGIGSILGKSFLRMVPVIGYKASMFNLVFESNVASIKLWRRLGFKEIGRVPKAGRLRGQGRDGNEGYVDAIQFYWDFETMVVPAE